MLLERRYTLRDLILGDNKVLNACLLAFFQMLQLGIEWKPLKKRKEEEKQQGLKL